MKQLLILLLSSLFIVLLSFECDDDYYNDFEETPSCQVKILNMSANSINVCVVGHKKAIEETTDDSFVLPTIHVVYPGEYGKEIDIRMNNKGNSNWGECFSDVIDMLYVAIAVEEKSITKWMEDLDESRLLKLYKFSLDDLGANNKRKNVYYF